MRGNSKPVGRRRGATLILYTMILTFLVLPLIGLGIDLTRVYVVQGRLQTAVDAAALGATRLLSTSANTTEIATEFLHANYPPNYWSSSSPSVTNISITTTTNQTPNKSTVKVSATVSVPLIFLGFMSHNSASGLGATGVYTAYSLQGCTLSYPTGSAPSLSSVVFNEAEVLAAYGPTFVYPHGKIMAWYADEHALTLGVREVQVTTADGSSPLSLTFPGGANGNVGTPYSATLTAAGGTSPYTFSISAGTLPAGLSLNASTGAITGQPTGTANSNITFMVTDSLGATVTATGTIQIQTAGALHLTVPGGTNGNVGTPFSAQLSATGGTGPYTFSITSGSLAAGLSLNASTGLISGIPTAQASGPAANVTFKVTDANNATNTANGTINIGPAAPLNITFPGGTNGTVGVAMSFTLSATGGTGPYTYSVSAGTLPAGLSLNASTGVVSGAPTTAVSGPAANVTFQVRDSTSATKTAAGAINIVAAPSGSGSGSGSGGKLTTITDYPIASYNALTQNAVSTSGPLSVGTTAMTGQQAGTDIATWTNTYGYLDKGRPMWPALFITDITVNASSTAGDWQQGGTAAVPPNAVYGTWKGAVRAVDTTTSPYTITITPDADPAGNTWAGVPDTPPGGFPSTQGYGSEVVWNIDSLGLRPGRTYRLQFMVHDGDQNGSGGDVGEGCSVAIY